MVEAASITGHNVHNSITVFSSKSFNKLYSHLIQVICFTNQQARNPTATNFPGPHMAQCPITVCAVILLSTHHLVTSDWHINFLLAVICTHGSLLNAARQTGDVLCTPPSKHFIHHHILLAQMQTPPNTKLTNNFCSQTLLLY